MFKDALVKSAKQLLKLKETNVIADFALIGGMALSAFLEPRATADIDYVIQLKDQNLTEVAKKLKGSASIGDIYDPIAGAITYSVKGSGQSVPIQIIKFHSAIEEIAFTNIETLKFENIPIPIVNARGLIILKLYAGGPIDIEDARKLLALKEISTKDRNYIESKVKTLRIFSRFKQVVAA